MLVAWRARGCEAAWQLAERGVDLVLRESKPEVMSPRTRRRCGRDRLLEFAALRLRRVAGRLAQGELRRAGSLILACADATRVPRARRWPSTATPSRACHVAHRAPPRIHLERRVVDELPDGDAIVATGPLTGAVSRAAGRACGRPLYFYDAIAPIVDAETIDRTVAFRASRWARTASSATRSVGDAAGGATAPATLTARPRAATTSTARSIATSTPRCGRRARRPQGRAAQLRGGALFRRLLPIEVMADRGLECSPSGPCGRGLTIPAPASAARRRPAAPRDPPPVGVQPGRLPDAPRLSRAATHFPHDPGPRRPSSCAWVDPPQFLRRLAAPAGRRARAAQPPHCPPGGQITGVEVHRIDRDGLLAGRFAAVRARGTSAAPPPQSRRWARSTSTSPPARRQKPFEPMNINFGLLPP